jgi:hypothetical protein
MKMTTRYLLIGFLLMAALALVACGDDQETNADGDTDLDVEAEPEMPDPGVDCEALRSLPNPPPDLNCEAWCNKVNQCGGATDPIEECRRDCNALTYEANQEELERWANCIVNTSCSTWENAKELGDTSRNLELYCRARTFAQSSPTPDRAAFCDSLYETLSACGSDFSTVTLETCQSIWAPLYKNEAFRQIAGCQPWSCDNDAWNQCVTLGVCSMITDRF